MSKGTELDFKPDSLPMLERLSACSALPSPRGVAEKILAMAEDETATMTDFAEVIGVDVALTSQLLRLANSPIYGQRRKIDEVRQAITLIGLEATLTNAISIALVSSMRAHRSKGIDHSLFWRRSVAAASACRLLARHLREPVAETFFMGALLQDIGMIALESLDSSGYRGLGENQADHLKVIAHESATFGIDHASAGAWLIHRWEMPIKYCQALLASHEPGEVVVDAEYEKLAKCVAVSGLIADIYYGHDVTECLRRALAVGEPTVHLSPTVLQNMLPQLVVELTEMGGLFEIDLGAPEWLETRQHEALKIIEAEGCTDSVCG